MILQSLQRGFLLRGVILFWFLFSDYISWFEKMSKEKWQINIFFWYMGFVSLVRSFSLSFTLSELYCRNIFSSLLKLHPFISEYITRNALSVNPFACHPVNISRKSSPHSRTEIYSDEHFTINSISIIPPFHHQTSLMAQTDNSHSRFPDAEHGRESGS